MKKSKLYLRHYKNSATAGQIRVSFCDNINMSEQIEAITAIYAVVVARPLTFKDAYFSVAHYDIT